MPKKSNKEDKNPYFLKREELQLTRDQASELLESITADKIEKIENKRMKPHPDEVLEMAKKYKAPELCNYFCSNQCPIGQLYVPEVTIGELSQIIIRMVASLNDVQDNQKKLISIAADGCIDDSEIEDFLKIQDKLEKISATVQALQLWSEKMINTGVIDGEKIEACRKRMK